MNDEHRNDLLKGLLVGAAVGVVLGMLFAPEEGDKLRSKVRSRSRDLGDAARDFAGRTRENSEELIAGTAEDLARVAQRLRRLWTMQGERFRQAREASDAEAEELDLEISQNLDHLRPETQGED